MTGHGNETLSNKQRKLLTKRIKAVQAAAPANDAIERPERFRSTEAANGETIVTRYDVEKSEDGNTRLVPYDQRLGRLEYLEAKGVLNGRQVDAGTWIADRYEGYFSPGVSSGIEDHAPGSIPSDPLARWVRGQRTQDRHGNPRSPPPTFRPRRPAGDRRAHDGWSMRRCDALQSWTRANRLLAMMQPYDREVVISVAIDGLSLEETHMRITGAIRRPGGKQVTTVKRALQRGLDFIADETAPTIREVAA